MKPKELVLQWVDTFNRGQVEELANLYHEDAINHQVMFEPMVGKEAIGKMFAEEFSKAEMVCQVENIFEDGEWAILEWSDPLGLRGCGFFQIIDGKIKFQRGYWDQLSFMRQQGLELPKE